MDHKAEIDAVIRLDAETPLPVGVSTPCPSIAIAHLGFKGLAGVRVPCGLLAGHYPATRHVFHIEWTDPAPETSLRQRMDAAQTPMRRPQ